MLDLGQVKEGEGGVFENLDLNIDVAGGRMGATGVGAKEPGAFDLRFFKEVGGDKFESVRVHGRKVVK